MPNPQALLVGLAAALASALLFAGLVTQTATAVGFSLAAPIPIMIASLGWGSVAGVVAALGAAAMLSLFAETPLAGIMLLAAIAVPAAVSGHLAGLARPREERTGTPAPANNGAAPPLDWYPPERILFALAILAAVGCLVIGWMIGFSVETAAPMLRDALVADGTVALDANAEQIEDLARLVVSIVPFVQPAFLLATLVASLYLAAAATRLSGRLQRPRDDIPAQTALPRTSLPIFLVALALSFLGGPVGALGAVFTGAFAMAFTFVGLAAFHHRTRGRAGRGLLLFTVYAAIVVLSFPLLAFLVFGLFRTGRPPAAGASAN